MTNKTEARGATPLLQRVLLLDLVGTGGFALILILAAGWLAAPLGLGEAFLRVTGLLLVPFCGLVAAVARAAGDPLSPPRAGVRAILTLNAGWIVASIGILFTGWIQPTTMGQVFIAAQAVLVLVFAELQMIALKRANRMHPAGAKAAA